MRDHNCLMLLFCQNSTPLKDFNNSKVLQTKLTSIKDESRKNHKACEGLSIVVLGLYLEGSRGSLLAYNYFLASFIRLALVFPVQPQLP